MVFDWLTKIFDNIAEVSVCDTARRGSRGRRSSGGPSSSGRGGGGSKSGSKGGRSKSSRGGRGKSSPSGKGKGGGTKSGSKSSGQRKSGGKGKSAPSGGSKVGGTSSFSGMTGFSASASPAPAPAPAWHAAQTGQLAAAIASSKANFPAAWGGTSGAQAKAKPYTKVSQTAGFTTFTNVATQGGGVISGSISTGTGSPFAKGGTFGGQVSGIRIAGATADAAKVAAVSDKYYQPTGGDQKAFSITMESFTSASKEGSEKSWKGKKFSLNPAHITEGGGFDLAAASAGFLSFSGLGLVQSAAAAPSTTPQLKDGTKLTPTDISGGAIPGTNVAGWGDVGGIQATKDKKVKVSSDMGYVGDVNLAMPASAYSSDATGNELQLPTGEGSTIGGLSNLIDAAESMGWLKDGKVEGSRLSQQQGADTSSIGGNVIPFSILGSQGQTGYAKWALDYQKRYPKLAMGSLAKDGGYIPGMSQVGVKVDSAMMTRVIKLTRELKKAYDSGVPRINPDTGKPNEKIARLEWNIKLLTKVTGQLVNIPGEEGSTHTKAYGTIIGYKQPTAEVGTSGFQTGMQVKTMKVLDANTGKMVDAPIGATFASLGLTLKVKQEYNPKTGYMFTPPQTKEAIAKGQEIVGGPDAVMDFVRDAEGFAVYDKSKDTTAHPSVTGYDLFASATPKVSKIDASGMQVFKFTGPEGNVFESANEFLTKDSTPDKHISVWTAPDASGDRFAKDELTLSREYTDPSLVKNIQQGWDATKVMQGEPIYVDRPASQAEDSTAGKAGPAGHAMVKPVATLVSSLHTDPKTGMPKTLTAAEKKKFGFTKEFGITTYNLDGSVFSEMKQPHVGSKSEWEQLGGTTGNIISPGEQEMRVSYALGGYSVKDAGLGVEGAAATTPMPWWFGRDVIQMVDTNEDGTPDMLQIVPYIKDPQRPMSTFGFGDPGFETGELPGMPEPYAEPSPYEVPYYVDIEKATEMLDGGMTIDQILQHPPLDEGYMYWTDPTDQKEYVMTNEDYQEYLQAVAHQKKVEKQDKFEGIFMDVTQSMHRPNTRITRRRGGSPSSRIGRRMAADAPSEADIGGLVK